VDEVEAVALVGGQEVPLVADDPGVAGRQAWMAVDSVRNLRNRRRARPAARLRHHRHGVTARRELPAQAVHDGLQTAAARDDAPRIEAKLQGSDSFRD
jgi:hypothetical protein